MRDGERCGGKQEKKPRFEFGVIGGDQTMSRSRNFTEKSPRRCARHAANAMRSDEPAGRRVGFGSVFVLRCGICGAVGGKQRKRQIVHVEGRTATRAAGAARKGILFLTIHEDPFGDARLDIDFDEFIEDFDELLAKIGAIVQSGELKGLERNSGARGKVFKHWFGRFHDRASGNQLHIVMRGSWEGKNTRDSCNVNHKVTIFMGIKS